MTPPLPRWVRVLRFAPFAALASVIVAFAVTGTSPLG